MRKEEYIAKMEAEVAKLRTRLDELKVKASLGKLELRDRKRELLDTYLHVSDKLHELKEAGADRWEALREGIDAAVESFNEAYDRVIRK